MPYNVNPSCSQGLKTLIKWQFPVQPQRQNDQGDDYKVYRKPGQCLNAIYRITYTFQKVGNFGDMRGQSTRTVSYPVGTRVVTGDTGVYTLNRDYLLYGNSRYPFIATATARLQLPTGTFEDKQVSLTADPYSGAVPGTISHVISRVGGLSDNCGNYIVDIYKNGQIIQSDEGGQQPPVVTWECVGDQCPPNTCEVECGNTICCYNNQGISVLNFLKS